MRLKKTLVWLFSLGIFIVGLPIAFAANSIVKNVTISPDPFHTQVPGYPGAAKVFISYDWDAGGYSSGDVTEQIKDSHGNVVYYWGTNVGADTKMDPNPGSVSTIQLEWDGKANNGPYDGQYVPDGTYTFYVLSHVATPPDTTVTKTFSLEKTVAPILTLNTPPATTYNPKTGNFDLNYHLQLKSAKTSILDLKIDGPSGPNTAERVLSQIQNSDGDYTISWDGKMNNATAANGTYTFSFKATGSVDGFGVASNEMTGTINVSDVTVIPTVSQLTVGSDPYNPNGGNLNMGYTLNNSDGKAAITAAVYASTNTSNPVQSWDFSNQANGTNSVSWNGKYAQGNQIVTDGTYIFKVWGTDNSTTIVPVQKSFTVTAVNPNPSPNPQNGCAGFSDVDKNDSDCDAFTFMKSIGAMTGNPDGTLTPESFLQRDQVAKIVLETFKKFNSGTDYCHNTNPFPDVNNTAWSYQYVCQGVALGVITGYQAGVDAGFYRPARSVNRVEFLALVLRNLNENMPSTNSSSYYDVPSGQWFSGYAKYSKDNQLFVGANLYPTDFTTRREVAEVIYKLHQLGKL